MSNKKQEIQTNADEQAFAEAEARLKEYHKAHPQRRQSGLKGEELEAHNRRMGSFMLECRKNRGAWTTKIYADPEQLVGCVDRYLECVSRIGLFPTLTGLALYLDVSLSTISAIEKLNDERSRVFEKFRTYISEYFNQSGLASNTNPAFSIYYGKSMLGQSDNPQMQLNVTLTSEANLRAEEIVGAINATPVGFDSAIEVPYSPCTDA